MNLSRNGKPTPCYTPLYNGKKIIIGIDSSKSNTAIVVGNEFGEVYDDFEISGAGSDVDVYQLCWDTRKSLRTLFMGAEVLGVGIEDIITKKEEGYRGIEVHQSRKKITAVFDNIIFYFQEYHNIMPKLVNNQEWKAAILPEEFRSRNHKKGAKDWHDYLGDRWAGRKDDVTDALSIFQYTVRILGIKPMYKIGVARAAEKEFNYGYYPVGTKLPQHTKQFQLNDSLTLIQNIETATHQLKKDDIGYFIIPVTMLSLMEIYSERMLRKYSKYTENVMCVIKVKT